MHATLPLLRHRRFPAVRRRPLETLQVNLGYRCNQSCVHCHVNAGPTRTEMMAAENVAAVLRFLDHVATLDITGGAPELHPQFRPLVQQARAAGKHVIDRCNLTILQEAGQEDPAQFLAALRALNDVGYGRDLPLNLVYNPQGPSLPPAQDQLEADYKRELAERHGVVFNRLYTLANMPIQRFGSMLVSKGRFEEYVELLRGAHRDENLESVMCRSLVSVDWQGYVYDCDFNQMLGLPLLLNGETRIHLSQLRADELEGSGVVVRDHCYGCTAGQGSSCGGALQ